MSGSSCRWSSISSLSLIILALMLAVAPRPAMCQASDFPALEGPYLGQKPPGFTPAVFAPGIVSNPNYREYTYVFLPGATECVFDYYGDTEYKDGAIFTTRIEGGKWIQPEIYELFAGFGNVFLPRVSPDGDTWFFTSTALPMPKGVEGKTPLFYMEKTASGWSEPRYLDQAIHASATTDGKVYYMVEGPKGSRPGFRKKEKGKYSDLEHAEPAEYFGGDMAHLVVAPDESYMIFDSEQRTRVGECRLHISFKKPDGRWTVPMSMGSLIEQKAAMAWITYDGKYIFYKANDDVYWVNAVIVEKLRPKGIKWDAKTKKK